jgi:hypothetical protein
MVGVGTSLDGVGRIGGIRLARPAIVPVELRSHAAREPGVQ